MKNPINERLKKIYMKNKLLNKEANNKHIESLSLSDIPSLNISYKTEKEDQERTKRITMKCPDIVIYANKRAAVI